MKAAALTEQLEESQYGGKATQLAVALRAGLPVPNGVALPVSLVSAVAEDAPAALAELHEAARLVGFPLAARSSAVGEDSEEASFAGQHLTCLNVRSFESLVDAIRAIHASAHSDSALAYRQRLGLDGAPRIGVVVQELVAAERAGVLFTRNPIDGSDEFVVEASWGLGEAVVAGLVTPDRFRIARDGAVLERVSGTKDIAVESVANGGTTEREVSADAVHRLCIDDSELGALHSLALRCERVFGGTQDIEFAFARGALYLLQRRELTSIGGVGEP